MKKIKILTLLAAVFFVFISFEKVVAQDEIYTVLEGQLSGDESKQIEKAKESIKKAQEILKGVAAEDAKTEKFFKKNKAKKAEKKSAPAKKIRINAAAEYQKGYEMVYKIFDAKLKACNYAFDEDAQLASSLKAQGDDNFKSADAKLKAYKSASEKDLQKTEYAKLKTDLTASTNLRVAGLRNLGDAYTICLSQTDKKKKLEADELKAWQTAIKANTEEGYNDYISKNPRGKYVNDAQNKITDLQEAKKRASEDASKMTTSPYGLLYKIQIAASQLQLTHEQQAKLYPTTSEIEERFADSFYKYAVGNYSTYAEAKAALKSYNIRGSFVIVFKDGNQIKIKEAQKIEKQK